MHFSPEPSTTTPPWGGGSNSAFLQLEKKRRRQTTGMQADEDERSIGEDRKPERPKIEGSSESTSPLTEKEVFPDLVSGIQIYFRCQLLIFLVPKLECLRSSCGTLEFVNTLEKEDFSRIAVMVTVEADEPHDPVKDVGSDYHLRGSPDGISTPSLGVLCRYMQRPRSVRPVGSERWRFPASATKRAAIWRSVSSARSFRRHCSPCLGDTGCA